MSGLRDTAAVWRLLALVFLVTWLFGCFDSVGASSNESEPHCTRVTVVGLDLTKGAATREEAIDLLTEALRAWAFERPTIPTIVWDTEGRKTITEVQDHSCDDAVGLVEEIVGEKIGSRMYTCSPCEWFK